MGVTIHVNGKSNSLAHGLKGLEPFKYVSCIQIYALVCGGLLFCLYLIKAETVFIGEGNRSSGKRIACTATQAQGPVHLL